MNMCCLSRDPGNIQIVEYLLRLVLLSSWICIVYLFDIYNPVTPNEYEYTYVCVVKTSQNRTTGTYVNRQSVTQLWVCRVYVFMYGLRRQSRVEVWHTTTTMHTYTM